MKKSIIFGFLISIAITSCNTDNKELTELHFTTWENPCFDRCASIWLIQNYIDSTATFDFITFGEKVKEGIPFDVPGAELGRQKNICCFESVIRKYHLDDPAFKEMATVIHDIDVNKWGIKVTADADSLGVLFDRMKEIVTNEELVDMSKELFVNMYIKYRE